VRARLKVYHDQTEPLVSFYQKEAAGGSGVKYVKINGIGKVDQIRDQIFAALGLRPPRHDQRKTGPRPGFSLGAVMALDKSVRLTRITGSGAAPWRSWN